MKEKIFKKYVRYDFGIEDDFIKISYISTPIFGIFLGVYFFSGLEEAIKSVGLLVTMFAGGFSIVTILLIIVGWLNREVYYKEVKK